LGVPWLDDLLRLINAKRHEQETGLIDVLAVLVDDGDGQLACG